MLTLLLLVAAAIGAAFYLGRQSKPERTNPPPPQAVAGPDAATQVASLTTPDPVPVAPAPKPPAPPPPTKQDPAPAVLPALRPAIPTLEVVVEPAVTVSLGGRVMGRTPLTFAVPTGKHRLTLSDPGQGISLVRTVTIKPGANRFALTLGKGSVTVSAPAGAEVRIDGRVVGKTPLAGPVPVIEGSHKIQVNISGARWQQAFTLGDNERMNFEVELQGAE